MLSCAKYIYCYHDPADVGSHMNTLPVSVAFRWTVFLDRNSFSKMSHSNLGTTFLARHCLVPKQSEPFRKGLRQTGGFVLAILGSEPHHDGRRCALRGRPACLTFMIPCKMIRSFLRHIQLLFRFPQALLSLLVGRKRIV